MSSGKSAGCKDQDEHVDSRFLALGPDSGVIPYFRMVKVLLNEMNASQPGEENLLRVLQRLNKPAVVKRKTAWRRFSNHFAVNWRYYLAVLLPFSFFGLCLLGEEVTPALATVTAVVIAGCVSMIVLQENKKIEAMKLDEKWLYDVRCKFHEYICLQKRVVSDLNSGVRSACGLPKRISITEELKVSCYTEEDRQRVVSYLSRFLEKPYIQEVDRLEKELELMLESSSRSDKAFVKVKAVGLICSGVAYMLLHGDARNLSKCVTAISYVGLNGADEIAREVRSYLDSEISKSKRGNVSLRRNIKALYLGVVSTALSFAAT